MADLCCRRCGTTASYADARMLDREETCSDYRIDPNGDVVELGRAHDWHGL